MYVQTKMLTYMLFCVISVLAATPARSDLVLVQEGVSQAPIIVFKDAPPMTRQAAGDLAEYIEKISGAKPEILVGQPKKIPEKAIWIGFHAGLKNIFPGTDFEFKHPEEILIKANENHLVIAGRDRWNPDQMTDPDRRGNPIPDVQQEYGTVNAIYTFLEEHLGVRWLWPGELGTDIIPSKTIALKPIDVRYHPVIRDRSSILRFSSRRQALKSFAREWVKFSRMELDSMNVDLGHAFTEWWDRFHQTHPEYFALQPDGTRSGFPSPTRAKLCQSNPAVWEQWISDVRQELEANPNKVIFSAAPNDSWLSGHCICENCSAWDHPEGEKRAFIWKGARESRVALSDRYVTFANHLGRRLKEEFPGRGLHVSIIGYGHSRPAPISAVPDDNVIITHVANFYLRSELLDRGSPSGQSHQQQYKAWSNIVPQIIWRPNTGSPSGWRQGLPDVDMNNTIKAFHMISRNDNTVAVCIDSVWEHWSTQGPEYYVLAKMAWNPKRDGQAVLDDYYRRAFGPAYKQMKAYWEFMETTRNLKVTNEKTFEEVYTPAFFDHAQSLLQQASQQVTDQLPKYSERIQFVQAGLDYSKLVSEMRPLAASYHAGKGKDKAAADALLAKWEVMKQMSVEHPQALNWKRLSSNTSRMGGLYPGDAADSQIIFTNELGLE